MKMKLLVDDIEVSIGAEFQRYLVNCIPDSHVYSDLLHTLAQSNDADIRRDVADKDNISEETALLLIDDKDPYVIDGILNSSAAKSVITLDKIKTIIETSGSEVVKTVISNIDEYEQIDSVEVADIIYKLNEPQFHLDLASGWSTPKKILRKLAESDDPDIQTAANNNLD